MCKWIQTWVIHIGKLKCWVPKMKISIPTYSQSMTCSKYFYHITSIMRFDLQFLFLNLFSFFFPVKKLKWFFFFLLVEAGWFFCCGFFCVCFLCFVLKANPHHFTISFFPLKCHSKERNQIFCRGRKGKAFHFLSEASTSNKHIPL